MNAVLVSEHGGGSTILQGCYFLLPEALMQKNIFNLAVSEINSEVVEAVKKMCVILKNPHQNLF